MKVKVKVKANVSVEVVVGGFASESLIFRGHTTATSRYSNVIVLLKPVFVRGVRVRTVYTTTLQCVLKYHTFYNTRTN